MIEDAPVTSVKVGAHTVDIYVDTDADGAPFIELAGRDCDLQGELPGLYYVAPVSCRSCGDAPRADGSTYCADCLCPEGPGAPPRVV